MAKNNREFILIDNFSSNDKLMGFRKRNIIEGAIAALIFAFLVHFVPFVTRVYIIVALGGGLSIFVLFLVGVRNRSITEWLINVIKYKFFNKKYSFRSVKYEKYRSVETTDEFGQRYSLAEQGLAFFKQWRKESKGTGSLIPRKSFSSDGQKEKSRSILSQKIADFNSGTSEKKTGSILSQKISSFKNRSSK